MNSGVDAWLAGMPWPRLLGFVIDVSIKAAIVVAGAWLATLLLRRSSAYARSTVWIFALVVLLALPLTQIVTPLWNLPLIPEVGRSGHATQIAEKRAKRLDDNVLLAKQVIHHDAETLFSNSDHYDEKTLPIDVVAAKVKEAVQAQQRQSGFPELDHLIALDRLHILPVEHEGFEHRGDRQSIIAAGG